MRKEFSHLRPAATSVKWWVCWQVWLDFLACSRNRAQPSAEHSLPSTQIYRTRPCVRVCGEGGVRLYQHQNVLTVSLAWIGSRYEPPSSRYGLIFELLLSCAHHLLDIFGRTIWTEPNGSISRAGLEPRRGEEPAVFSWSSIGALSLTLNTRS